MRRRQDGNAFVNRASGSSARCFGYDAIGNLASDCLCARTFGYDAFKRLASFNASGALTCGCRSNALNQRAWKGTPAGSTSYVSLGGRLLGIVRA